MKNWKNFMYMIFDRFFAYLIVSSFMPVFFFFFLQVSNLTFTAEVYDNSVNSGFFMLVYICIVCGLYSIVYDYKTDKLIQFNCQRGKYAIAYISLFFIFILTLGVTFQSSSALYFGLLFSILAFALILYQCPYHPNIRLNFQTISAVVCQFPLFMVLIISFILNSGQPI